MATASPAVLTRKHDVASKHCILYRNDEHHDEGLTKRNEHGQQRTAYRSSDGHLRPRNEPRAK